MLLPDIVRTLDSRMLWNKCEKNVRLIMICQQSQNIGKTFYARCSLRHSENVSHAMLAECFGTMLFEHFLINI